MTVSWPSFLSPLLLTGTLFPASLNSFQFLTGARCILSSLGVTKHMWFFSAWNSLSYLTFSSRFQFTHVLSSRKPCPITQPGSGFQSFNISSASPILPMITLCFPGPGPSLSQP